MSKGKVKFQTFTMEKCSYDIDCNNCNFNEKGEGSENIAKSLQHHFQQTSHTEFDVVQEVAVKFGKLKVRVN